MITLYQYEYSDLKKFRLAAQTVLNSWDTVLIFHAMPYSHTIPGKNKQTHQPGRVGKLYFNSEENSIQIENPTDIAFNTSKLHMYNNSRTLRYKNCTYCSSVHVVNTHTNSYANQNYLPNQDILHLLAFQIHTGWTKRRHCMQGIY